MPLICASNHSVLATTMLGRARAEEEKPVYLSPASSHRLPRWGGSTRLSTQIKVEEGMQMCAKMTMLTCHISIQLTVRFSQLTPLILGKI